MKRKVAPYIIIVFVLLLSLLIYCDFFRSRMLIWSFSVLAPLLVAIIGFLVIRNYHAQRKTKMNYMLIVILAVLFSFLGFKGISRTLLTIDTSFFINNKSNVAIIIVDNNLLYVKGPDKTEVGELFFISRQVFPNYRYVLNDYVLESVSDGVINIKIWGNEIVYNKFDNFIINGKSYNVPRAEFLSNTQPFLEISKGQGNMNVTRERN